MMKIIELIAARHNDPFANRSPRIVCLGDSVTHGCFEVYMDKDNKVQAVYETPSGYVRRLNDKLLSLYPVSGLSIINSGIGGDSTTGALKRFERDVAVYRPDLVTVCLGLNDSMTPDFEAGLAKYKANMTEIFARIRGLGAEAMLITPNMMCSYVDPALGVDILKGIAAECAKRQTSGILTAYVDAAREVAREAGIPIADAYAEWQAMERAGIDTTALLSNHINHPTRELHDIFVNKIMEQLLY